MPGNSGGSLKFPTFTHKLHAACLKKIRINTSRALHAVLNGKN